MRVINSAVSPAHCDLPEQAPVPHVEAPLSTVPKPIMVDGKPRNSTANLPPKDSQRSAAQDDPDNPPRGATNAQKTERPKRGQSATGPKTSQAVFDFLTTPLDGTNGSDIAPEQAPPDDAHTTSTDAGNPPVHARIGASEPDERAMDHFLPHIERDARAIETEIEPKAVPDPTEERIGAEIREIQAQRPRPDRQARKVKADPSARIPLAHSLDTEIGWVSVPRAVFSSKFGFREEPYTQREAWLWLLLNAAWEPKRRVIDGTVVDLQRGQGVASVRFMAGAWGWEPTKVWRFLNRLKRSKTPTRIATATTTGLTVVTICHYEAIQNIGSTTAKPTATLSATNPQRTRNKRENKKTRQEGNKSESINHVTSEIPIKTQNRGEDGPTQPSVLPASDLNFYQFWERYPHKTGKPKARKSFDGIRAKRLVTQADLMAGLNRYIADKPIDRSWLNPATFLNQQRWADEPAPVVAAEPRPLPGAVVPFKPRPPARVALDVPALSEGEWLKHLTAFNHRNEWDRSILGPPPLERGCGAPRKLIIAAGLQPPEPLVNFGNGVVKPLGEAAARPPAIPPDRLEDTP